MKKKTKARIKIFCSGYYGKSGEEIVELNEVVRFKNGNINKNKTIEKGYTIVEVIKKAYGFGLRDPQIVEILD